jgi:hypothetical protein
MSWQIGHYVFIPCNDQIHGDGQPDLESVALLPADATVQGPLVPWQSTRGGGAEIWNGSSWVPNTDIRSGPRGANVGQTRSGGREMWSGTNWVPNLSGQISAGVAGAAPLIAWKSTRGGGAEIWNGSQWVPNNGAQGAAPSRGINVGATRNGGREMWTGSAWVPNPSGRASAGVPGGGPLIPWQSTRGGGAEIWSGTQWVPNTGGPGDGGGPIWQGGAPTYGMRRNGGREVWNGGGWVPWRRGWDQGPGAGALIPWQSTRGGGAEIWTGTGWIANPQAAEMSATDALSFAGMLGGPQTAGGYTLSPSDLVALGAQAAQAAQQPPADTDAGGQDLLSLLAADGSGDDGGADAIDLDAVE